MNQKKTLREVVYQAIRFEETDVCPYYIWVDKEMVPELARHYGQDSFVGSPDGTRTFAGSYTIMRDVTARPVIEKGDLFTDEFGTEFRRGNVLHVLRPVLGEPSLKGYEFPDLASDEHFDGLGKWLDSNTDRFRIVQLSMMFFERTWFMRGMENILMDLHLHPSFVQELLEGLESVCLRVIDRLLRDYGNRIDAIGMSEDYGTQRSLLISPQHWRKLLKPHLARLCERIRAGGKLVYLHSCGHVTPIIPDLVEVGVNCLQPLQPEAMDIFDIKRRFGRNLCLMGGISTQRTLPSGAPDDVRREVRECLTRMGAGGGYVMAPAKPILPGVPLENAIALIDAFVDQAR
ncbi:MAG TPA: uroporphyrinogen decarboxylase family protein [Phycisphaerae bacterium]|nr:uroporphyrinogen decarboxylase family protein [Phycisphaerae bacterium]HRY69662.1 uroporphyrinogen decarboxylase family protein [Phycisphaerae bacterium]HSA29646.1 uroporphyrinogen decarboxylase family protein [Phycisphaerae bacterium]